MNFYDTQNIYQNIANNIQKMRIYSHYIQQDDDMVSILPYLVIRVTVEGDFVHFTV